MTKLLQNCLIANQICSILINDEYIDRILFTPTGTADVCYQCDGLIALPGMMDLHTHVRDLEYSYKEDWTSASSAALSGGVTTIFDMPNSKPPTDSLPHLAQKFSAAKKSKVNYGLYAGVSNTNYKDLQEILEFGNVASIKIFLAGASSNEIICDEEYLKKILRLAKEFHKPVAAHCESQAFIADREQMYCAPEYDHARYHNFIRGREAASRAVEQILRLSEEIGNALHILHVSTKEEMELIKKFKKRGGFPLTCEITPHHIFLNENILQSIGNVGKVNPPLRTVADTEALTQDILDGWVDTIGSDHAPHSIEEKSRNYFRAPSGFPGLETTLPLLIHYHLQDQLFDLALIQKLTSANPAHIVQVKKRGKLESGYYADITLIDPNETQIVNPQNFNTKAKYSPFAGMTLRGKIVKTFVNGEDMNPTGKEILYG